jgi:hypothetical protein
LFMEQISRNDNAKIILTPIKPLWILKHFQFYF